MLQGVLEVVVVVDIMEVVQVEVVMQVITIIPVLEAEEDLVMCIHRPQVEQIRLDQPQVDQK